VKAFILLNGKTQYFSSIFVFETRKVSKSIEFYRSTKKTKTISFTTLERNDHLERQTVIPFESGENMFLFQW